MSNFQQSVIVIFGPTAVGKSRVAAQVAAALDGEIVSADSMQVYRGLPIITDQPDAELLQKVPHHLVGWLGLDQQYSAARYVQDAAGSIAAIAGRGRLPLLAGGTGLYLRALLGGFSFAGQDESVRAQWERFIAERGAVAAYRELERLDPASAALIDRDNPRRLLRALEAAELAAAGDSPTMAAERQRLWSPASNYRVLSFGLELPREQLYRRIDQRVDEMLAGGAVDEVAAARQGAVARTVAQAIGFQELAAHLDGALTLPEAAAAIKQRTRRYAKRQLTWMRKMPDLVKIDLAAGSPAQAAAAIIERIRNDS